MLNRLSPASAFEASEVEHRFDLREALSFLWRQWKFIAAVVAVVSLVGIVLLVRQTPLYTATSQILLDRQKEKAPGVEAILTDVNLDFAMVESQMAIIRSSIFLRRVAEKENLVSDPEFGRRTRPVSSDPPTAPSAEETKLAPADDQASQADLVGSAEALKGAVSVIRAGQGYVLAISVT